MPAPSSEGAKIGFLADMRFFAYAQNVLTGRHGILLQRAQRAFFDTKKDTVAHRVLLV